MGVRREGSLPSSRETKATRRGPPRPAQAHPGDWTASRSGWREFPSSGSRSPPAARAQAAGQKDAPRPPPLLPRPPRARFQGPAGRPQPRPPSHARGPAATAAALAWLADIAAALSARASRATVLPQLLSSGRRGWGGAGRGQCAGAGLEAGLGDWRPLQRGGRAEVAGAGMRAPGFEVPSGSGATMQLGSHAHLPPYTHFQKSQVGAPTTVSLSLCWACSPLTEVTEVVGLFLLCCLFLEVDAVFLTSVFAPRLSPRSVLPPLSGHSWLEQFSSLPRFSDYRSCAEQSSPKTLSTDTLCSFWTQMSFPLIQESPSCSLCSSVFSPTIWTVVPLGMRVSIPESAAGQVVGN